MEVAGKVGRVLTVGEDEYMATGLDVPVCVCAVHACSRSVVRCSALYAGSVREASGHDVLVYGRAPKVASLGSWDMYSLALRRRVMGLRCITLLILKQLQRASYRVSGMCHGSSYSCFLYCLCRLCSFRSFMKVSL